MKSSVTASGKKPLIRIIGILLLFLLFISVTASLYTYILSFVIFSEEHYSSLEITDTYIDKMKSYIEAELDAVTGRYSLPYETVSGLLSDEAIGNISATMISDIYNALLTGGEHTETIYDISAYKDAILSYVETLPDGHMLREPAVYEPLFTRLEETITYSLDPIPLSQIRKFVPGISSVMQLGEAVGKLFPLFALLSVAFTAAALLIPSNKLHMRLYSVSGAVFAAATVYFVPSMLISNYDVPARLALIADSSLRTVVSTIWYSITDALMTSATLFFVFACVIAVSSVAAVTIHNIKADRAKLEEQSKPSQKNDAVSEDKSEGIVHHRKRVPKRFIEPTEKEAADASSEKSNNENNSTQTE